MKISNFVNDCINGDALLSEIDDYIDLWHESDNKLPIHTFLGMSEKEYGLYVLDEEYLGLIIAAHKENIDVAMLYDGNVHRLAARSDDSSKSRAIENWLKKENLWE